MHKIFYRNLYIFYIVVTTVFFVSCSDTTKDFSIQSSKLEELSNSIDSINKIFLSGDNIESVSSENKEMCSLNVRKVPGKIDYYNVIKSDAIGFGTGVLFGTCEGILIGTAIFPGVGSAWGAVADGICAGMAFGIVSSVVAVQNYCIARYPHDDLYHMKDWISYNDNMLFDKSIIGGNIGWCHNYVIQKTWGTYIEGLSAEKCFYVTLESLEKNDICKFINQDKCSTYFYNNWCKTYKEGLFYSSPYYEKIIADYIKTVEQLEGLKRFDYSSDVMKKITESGLMKEEIYLLNGTISTFYYSSLLWDIK